MMQIDHPPVATRRGMSGSLSTYLDLLRFSAALAVFAGHILDKKRWIGRNYGVNFHNDAVMVFFVLSGTVIGYTSQVKEHRLSTYLRARLARLWSVAIPVLLILPILSAIGMAWGSRAIPHPIFLDARFLETFLLSAFFLNQALHFNIVVHTDPPYWSLSYEFWYYILFASAFYLRGWVRAAGFIIAAVISGPRILLLFPVWLLGLLVWQEKDRIPAKMGWPLVIGSTVMAVFLSTTSLGMHFGAYVDSTLLRGRSLIWSRDWAWKYILGVLVALNVAGFAAVADQVSFGRAAKFIRYAAGSTFTLYLLHFPLLIFLNAVLPGPPASVARAIELAALALPIIAVVAHGTERQKHLWRAALDQIAGVRLFTAPAPAPSRSRSGTPQAGDERNSRT